MCDCESCTRHKKAPQTFTNIDILREDLRTGRVEHIGYTESGKPIYRSSI